MSNSNRIPGFIFGALTGAILMSAFIQSDRQLITGTPTQPETAQSSRLWMELAQDIVREDKPTPPASARLYAYVATAYYETLRVSESSAEASKVTHEILTTLLGKHAPWLDALLASTTTGAPLTLSQPSLTVRDSLLDRIAQDGFDTAWNAEQPNGPGYWSGKNPFSPMAGTWKRWFISESDSIVAPPPPPYGSIEHTNGLTQVKQAAMNRTVEQGAAVNFWGGVPGTEAPAGIWQNRLYDETRDYTLSDSDYAYVQMILAQALADSFMECWEEKYRYWTARPSMDDPSITEFMAMNNPGFPSYTSGHSTISSTAATILSAFFPDKKDLWFRDAMEARDSRLWAGIHFPYDNMNGFALGEKIGMAFVDRMDIAPLR